MSPSQQIAAHYSKFWTGDKLADNAPLPLWKFVKQNEVDRSMVRAALLSVATGKPPPIPLDGILKLWVQEDMSRWKYIDLALKRSKTKPSSASALLEKAYKLAVYEVADQVHQLVAEQAKSFS